MTHVLSGVQPVSPALPCLINGIQDGVSGHWESKKPARSLVIVKIRRRKQLMHDIIWYYMIVYGSIVFVSFEGSLLCCWKTPRLIWATAATRIAGLRKSQRSADMEAMDLASESMPGRLKFRFRWTRHWMKKPRKTRRKPRLVAKRPKYP